MLIMLWGGGGGGGGVPCLPIGLYVQRRLNGVKFSTLKLRSVDLLGASRSWSSYAWCRTEITVDTCLYRNFTIVSHSQSLVARMTSEVHSLTCLLLLPHMRMCEVGLSNRFCLSVVCQSVSQSFVCQAKKY